MLWEVAKVTAFTTSDWSFAITTKKALLSLILTNDLSNQFIFTLTPDLVPQVSQLVQGDSVRSLRVPEIVHVLPRLLHTDEGAPAVRAGRLEGRGEGRDLLRCWPADVLGLAVAASLGEAGDGEDKDRAEAELHLSLTCCSLRPYKLKLSSKCYL